MAKQPSSKNGTSRIRFIMLDAEIPEGDLSQITSAIQNALKPTTTIIQQRLPAQPAASLPSGSMDADVEWEEEVFEPEDDARAEAPTPRQAREARPRKPTVPKVLELDLTSGVSFESYATEHAPKAKLTATFVVLAWFKEHRPEAAVTANHVYTCYRAMKWPSGIDDFSWPLRALKKEQLVTSAGRGQYTINHLGIARVEKMGPAA
ncbi:MAG: hypothetical protein MEQ84_04030 [Mesorhizobium sp.]|nr:hypothetical protein [Mesorhizobium sp.]